jgi:hypothetical protein
MIKRITDPEDLKKAVDDLHVLFEDEDKSFAHVLGLRHNKETIINSFSNAKILAFDVFVWGNKEGDNYDALGIFINDKSIKFGINILSEFLWLSKNPKAGFKILKEATNLAREKNISYVSLSTVDNHPLSERNEKLYEKLGFVKDSTTFIGKL